MKSIVTVLALLMTGCSFVSLADTQELPLKHTYTDSTKAEVWENVLASLRANDLPVTASDFRRGKIRVRQYNYLNYRWAACPNIDIRSFDPLSPANFGIRASPLYRGVDLRLEIIGTEAGTRLSMDPRFFDVGRDGGRREYAFQMRCQSTGVLERTLFRAADGT